MNFKESYGQWTVQVSEQGNARVLSASREPVLVIRASTAVQDTPGDGQVRHAFALEIMRDLLADGLVRTAKKYQANFAPKFAQVVSGGVNNMEGFKDHNLYGSPLEGGLSNTDMADQLRTEGGPETTRTDATDATDMEEESRGSPPDDTTEDGALDHEKKIKDITNTTSDARMDMREKRKPFSMGEDNVLKDEVHNHVLPLSRKKSSRQASVAGAPDLVAKWRAMDKEGPRVRFAADGGGKCGAIGCKTAAEEDGYCAKHAGGKGAKPWEKDASRTEGLEAAVSRLEKLAEARIKKARAEAEAEVEARQAAAVSSFIRALHIVAARTAADLEQAPLKLAAEAVLSEPRMIGKDAATGEAIEYRGLDPELTRYLVAQLYDIGHADHIAMLTKRASELMQKGDSYLVDAEADLANVRVELPRITQARVAEVDEAGLRAAELRVAAASGNLQFTPAPSSSDQAAPGGAGSGVGSRRAAIQHALGGTVVAGQRGRLGLH